jgi:hypothetical protein
MAVTYGTLQILLALLVETAVVQAVRGQMILVFPVNWLAAEVVALEL